MPEVKYHSSISTLPLRKFIDVVVDDNIYALVISGKPEKEQLLESWYRIGLEYADGLIDKESYEKEKSRIEKEAIKDALSAQLKYFERILKLQETFLGKDSEAVKKLRGEIAKLKKEISEFGTGDDGDDEPTALQKWALKAEKNLTTVKDIYDKASEIISGFLDASTAKQKNQIEEQIKLLDERTAKEIESINQTVTNKEEAANKIAIVEARAAAKKQLLDNRQRELDQRRAQFEKAAAIGTIVIQTAINIVKALGSAPYPANIPLAAAAAALGAAQLAIAIATPIPKFKGGKKASNDYQGPAVVGDGGRSELIERADGSFEMTPAKPTLTYVGKDDVIHPSIDEALKKIKIIQPDPQKALQHSISATDRLLAGQPAHVVVQSDIHAKEIVEAVYKNQKEIVRAIKNKTEHHYHVEGPMTAYIKKTGDSWTRKA